MTPRYGAQVVGGAEAVAGEAARGFAQRGWEVEILTTCAVDHYTWENALPAGCSHEDGLLVRRFPTVFDLSSIGRRAQDLLEQGKKPSFDEQLSWLGFQFRAPELFHHLVRFGRTFDAVVFSPYLFWTTSVGMYAVVERAIVMPCLHDEVFARLEVFRPVLAEPASVWFLSEPEHELAHRLGPVADRHVVTGAGVHPPGSYDPDEFGRRHGITRPFLLYAGRREAAKGWTALLEHFRAVVASGLEVDLVTIGVGETRIPADLAGRVVDLGFVSAAERDDAFAAAVASVHPGRMESFSRTAMESWLAGAPVIATAAGDVVAWHCRRSGGGLLYSDSEGFVAAVQKLMKEPQERLRLASLGRDYVGAHYRWEVVLDAMEEDLRAASWRSSL